MRFAAVAYPIDQRRGGIELPLLSVSQYHGVIPRSEITDDEPRAADLSNYKVVRAGQLVLNRMSAYHGALGVASQDGIVSPDYMVLQFRKNQIGSFWQYFMKSTEFIGQMAARVRGIGTLESAGVRTPRLGYADLKLIPAPSLSPAQQRAIADFLDPETAKIDALIEKQKELIELLLERRAGVHTQLTSPSHWDRVPLRHIATAIQDCPHWTPDSSPDSPYEAVRSGCIRDGQYRPEAAISVSKETFERRQRGIAVEPGDLLFAREAPAGEACLAPSDRNLCLGQRTVLIKLDTARIRPEIVLAAIYSRPTQDYFRIQMNGSTVGNLRLPVIRSIPVPIPPKQEQPGLVGRYINALSKIDALIAKAEEHIALAQERRAALITAAVTGQLDIPGADR